MLEQLIYINHQNEKYAFGQDGIFADTHELRNYEWTPKKRSERITGFENKITKLKLPLKIVCESSQRDAALDRLYEITEKDVLANKPGRVQIGDYYLSGFVTKSKKKDFLTAREYAQIELTISTDSPFWVREHKYTFGRGGAEAGGNNLDYPFDWLFDYKSESGASSFASQSVWSSNFRIVIFGVTSDPEIRINGHLYKVFGDIGENEYLTIDSSTREIYLTTNIGNRVNRFNDRYRRSYIFEQIAAGMVNVMWDGKFAFELYILDERREPKWN